MDVFLLTKHLVRNLQKPKCDQNLYNDSEMDSPIAVILKCGTDLVKADGLSRH
jgi:hypothetical protein